MAEGERNLVLDGGFATEIASTHGHQYIDDDPLWSARLLATNIDVLKLVHKSFLESGSDIIESASYQASVKGLVKHLGMSEDDAHQTIVRSGEIAREVRDQFWSIENNRKGRRRPLVAGSVGPYGACQYDGSEYSGKYVDDMMTEELESWHRPQIRAQVDSGVDLIAFDTIPALKEAQAIINVLREFPSTKAWISFSCKDTQQICHGETIQEATEITTRCNNVIAVGINCLPPQNVSMLLKHIPDNVKATKSIVVYPNSGESWSDNMKWVGKPECTPIHDFVPQWLSDGATWIGGCCRVGPSDISHIRAAMYKHGTT